MATENKFDIYPVRQFGTRRNYFLGADRELAMIAGLLCFTIIFASITILFIPTIIGGIFLWFILIFILRRLAKFDPLFRFVYFRHIKYQRYYPAHSSAFRRCTHNYKNLSQRTKTF